MIPDTLPASCDAEQPTIEITHFTKTDGPLTKRIYAEGEGTSRRVVSDGSACTMSEGTARRVLVRSIHDAAAFFTQMGSGDAIGLGSLRDHLPSPVDVTTQPKLAEISGDRRPDLISRTGDFIGYVPGKPAFVLIDIDMKGMSEEKADRVEAAGGFWGALCHILPALATTARIVRSSTSSEISWSDTGEKVPGSGGLHIYIAVKDGADVERFLRVLHERCWLAGFGWFMVGKGGQRLERSIVDRSVWGPERLVFEGAPVVVPPLVQDRAARAAVAYEGNVLDTREACPELGIAEKGELEKLKAIAAEEIEAQQAAVRESLAQKLAAATGVSLAEARRTVEQRADGGILHPDFVPEWDDASLSASTIGDVLKEPGQFVGRTMADPLEGRAYGRDKAIIKLRADGTPWIYSFAHGLTTYKLRYDARAARAAIDAAAPAEVKDTLVRVVLRGDLNEAELDKLLGDAATRSGIGKTLLKAELKSARKAQNTRDAEAARRLAVTQRTDPRPQIPAPAADAPWLPEMEKISDVLSTSKAAEPPMRNIDGVLTEVRVRAALGLHALTSEGSNEGDQKDSRLPAPEQLLLAQCDKVRGSEVIERHADYQNQKGESCHLPMAFVEHFLKRDDALSVVASVATAPLVKEDGGLLAARGLDRTTGIYFRIPERLQALLPKREDITDADVAQAMYFLKEKWLVDVLADDVGKAILVAAALTVIERALLPERPAFFVTAGRRGGGKTTLLMMLLMAVTGVRPSAAAWSFNEEERRKALMSHLMDGLPALTFDNIPRGAQLSCPHIETILTKMSHTDRKLGVSETVTVPCTTVIFFTGNNIGPKGDLASRSLVIRLGVDRPDPENRPFRHPDPVRWTEEHRGEILAALYTILLGNPVLGRAGVEPETRFKAWWRLVGSAVEHASGLVGTEVRFRDVFRDQEGDDEEGASLVDALAVLLEQFPGGFKAADVARLLNDGWEWDGGAVEQCGIIRNCFFPETPFTQRVSAVGAGKKLVKHVDEPVSDGERVLILRVKKGERGKNDAVRFSVEIGKEC